MKATGATVASVVTHVPQLTPVSEMRTTILIKKNNKIKRS